MKILCSLVTVWHSISSIVFSRPPMRCTRVGAVKFHFLHFILLRQGAKQELSIYCTGICQRIYKAWSPSFCYSKGCSIEEVILKKANQEVPARSCRHAHGVQSTSTVLLKPEKASKNPRTKWMRTKLIKAECFLQKVPYMGCLSTPVHVPKRSF